MSAERVTEEAIQWLRDNEDEEFFLWLHYMEGHRPYGVHDEDPEFLKEPWEIERIIDLMKTAGINPDDVTEEEFQDLKDLYDSDVRYCSRHLSTLFDELQELELWNGTDIIFSSDHGTELREHGLFFHRNIPYNELLHVPLIVKSSASENNRCDEQRELLDVAPTICEFHGIDSGEFEFLGEPLFEGESREVIALDSQFYREKTVVAGMWEGWKYIYTEDSELLFDLDSDPSEQQDVSQDHPDIVKSFTDTIPDRLFERDPKLWRKPEDKVDKEQLEALGYLEMDEFREKNNPESKES